MKYKVLILSVLLFSSLSISAQYKDFVCGMKLGSNLQWANSKDQNVINRGTKLGYNWGFVAEYYFFENYGFTSGFSVDYLRNRYSFLDNRIVDLVNYTDVNVTRSFRATYVDVPLKMKMKTDRFGKFAYFAEVGFSVGVKLNAKVKDSYNIEGVLYNDEDFHSVSKQYRLFRTAFLMDAGAEYTLNGATKLFAQLAYNQGLSNLYVDHNDRDIRLKTGGFGLEVGIIF